MRCVGFCFMEEYRRGCNELHSKCSRPQGRVGSNPTSSAIVEMWRSLVARLVRD